ncbi:MAG: HlyD family efflux transporter periplasmic adaptor subunit [Myxococcales bacterium]|nr:HlyD family efflux transporter periplasmic adaptor subunit [Myxococcales bacterium]
MKKQLIAGALLVIALSIVIAYRVHAQNAYKDAPSGGSATLEGTELVVATKVGGRLAEVLVEEGDTVTAGQVVAKLDCDDQSAALAVARARVKQAEAQGAVAEAAVASAKDVATAAGAQVAVAAAHQSALDIQRQQAARNRERASALASEGAATTVDLESADTAHKGLEAESRAARASVGAASLSAKAQSSTIASASAQVELARTGLAAAEAEVARVELAVRECVLVAPHAGTIVGRLHEPGAVLGPGARVLTLIDLATVKAVFFLPNAELGRARIGAEAEVRVDAYPARVFSGTVRRVASEAEFTPRNVQTREDRDRLVYAVEITLDNPERELRAGMPAEVVLTGTQP